MLKYKIKKIFLFIVAFLCYTLSLQSYGLRFLSPNSAFEKHTIYKALDGIKFSNNLYIEFDIEIYKPQDLGCFLKINGLTNDNSILFSYAYDDLKYSEFKLNVERKEVLINDTILRENLGTGKWHKIKMNFSLKSDSVYVSINDKKFRSKVDLYDECVPEILFGYTSYSQNVGFSIRNLRIQNDENSFFFPLNEHNGDCVHEINNKVIGKVDNPLWLMNKHYKWNKIYSLSVKDVSSVDYNTDNNTFVIISKDSLFIYNPINNISNGVEISKNPIEAQVGNSFYNSNKVYLYEVNNIPDNGHTFVSFDLNSYEWKLISNEQLSNQRHHHVKAYNSRDSILYIFGGFGNRKYFSSFKKFDFRIDKWGELPLSGDTIYPRFFPSIYKIDDEKCYIYGGLGNKLGDQTLGTLFYDDLYLVDFSKNSVKRLWNNVSYNELVPVRNMYLDKDSLYILNYPTLNPSSYLFLSKVSIKDGGRVLLGDSIPFISDNIKSNANLYYNKDREIYYAYTQEYIDDNASKISIYELYGPPVPFNDLSSKSDRQYGIIEFVILSFCIFFICIIIFKRKGFRIHNYNNSDKNISNNVIGENHEEIETKKNRILLLGEFQTFDRDGNDITFMFTEKIKNVFVLLLLNSLRTEDIGLSARSLSSLLWPDKEYSESKNVRGVTISNLRKILNMFDGVDLMCNKHYFKIEVNDALCFCDIMYLRKYKLTDDIDNIVMLLRHGKFLQSFDSELFDSYKSEFESEFTNYIKMNLSKYFNSRDYRIVNDLVSSMFLIDALDINALWYSLQVCLIYKNKEKAREEFYKFKSRYKDFMGEELEYTFDEFITLSIIELPE